MSAACADTRRGTGTVPTNTQYTDKLTVSARCATTRTYMDPLPFDHRRGIITDWPGRVVDHCSHVPLLPPADVEQCSERRRSRVWRQTKRKGENRKRRKDRMCERAAPSNPFIAVCSTLQRHSPPYEYFTSRKHTQTEQPPFIHAFETAHGTQSTHTTRSSFDTKPNSCLVALRSKKLSVNPPLSSSGPI